jgi:hypothetical protein
MYRRRAVAAWAPHVSYATVWPCLVARAFQEKRQCVPPCPRGHTAHRVHGLLAHSPSPPCAHTRARAHGAISHAHAHAGAHTHTRPHICTPAFVSPPPHTHPCLPRPRFPPSPPRRPPARPPRAPPRGQGPAQHGGFGGGGRAPAGGHDCGSAADAARAPRWRHARWRAPRVAGAPGGGREGALGRHPRKRGAACGAAPGRAGVSARRQVAGAKRCDGGVCVRGRGGGGARGGGGVGEKCWTLV